MSVVRHEPSEILSLCVESGNLVWTAGIVAKKLDQDVKGQAAEILREIDRLLSKAGSSKSKVLSATIWVSDIRNRALMNEAWTAWADPKNLPGRACIEAKLADPRMLVEIAVVAAK
jgi:enamine deaminase RidA (YjgF/YER057c/UK114 family)